ncbi:acyltransferase family protein [Microbacterium sp. A93]|uniref:acyltransferase family protein n=1 Tax=Microbacterium sp. A93 TaxID=3450716 RepID=UPI003F4351C1
MKYLSQKHPSSGRWIQADSIETLKPAGKLEMTHNTLKVQVATQRTLRHDIQGLRAVAVIAVVVYHLWPLKLSGGYIGVDVFFVISGFLITAHLLGEVDRTGTVSLSRFWARRVRRLLPAAFLVLIVSFVLALTVIPRSQLMQNLTEIAASALYVQNWVLAFNAVDYLGADNAASLAQHYWSLSVEEQFYIAWPMLVLAAVWIASKLKRAPRLAIRATLGAVFIASLALSFWLTATNPAQAYFVTPTRAWEFAAGGLLAFAPLLAANFNRKIAAAASWVALGLILVPAFIYDASTPFPGWTALIPVAGTVTLIYIGDIATTWSPQYLLRAGVVQLLGDTSYAIYLWHWPLIFTYPMVFGGRISLLPGVLIFAVSVGLAWLTKKFVEDPTRRSDGLLGNRRRAFSFMASGLAVVVGMTSLTGFVSDNAKNYYANSVAAAMADTDGCFGAYALDNGCERPFATGELTNPEVAATDIPWRTGISPTADCLGEIISACDFGTADDKAPTVLFIGDSHAQHLVDPMAEVASENGWELTTLTRSGCTGFEVPTKFDDANQQERHNGCVEWGQGVEEVVESTSGLTLIVLSARAHATPVTSEDAIPRLEALRSHAPVVVLTDVPGMPNGVQGAVCVEDSEQTADPCSWDQPSRSNFLVEAVNTIGGTTIDLGGRLCTNGTCHAVIGEAIVYFDDNHLTTTFARTLAPWLDEQLSPLLSR